MGGEGQRLHCTHILASVCAPPKVLTEADLDPMQGFALRRETCNLVNCANANRKFDLSPNPKAAMYDS